MPDQTTPDQALPNQPLISVITAVHNCEAFLAEAIDSVLAQSYLHWEYWLVNDGSTDGTTTIARQAAASHPGRIHYLEHPGFQNRGLCSSRNLALSHARGSYIAILDADDVWLPNKLAEQVALARQFPQAGLIYGNSEYWLDWSGDPTDVGKNYVPPLAPGDRLYQPPELMRLPHGFGVPCPSDILLKRELFSKLGGFDESFDRHFSLFEDHAMLTKIYLAAPVYISNRCWDRYRIHPGSIGGVAARTGAIPTLRRHYLDWLRNYLVEQNVNDEIIWREWRQASLFYRHPVFHFLKRGARRLKRTLRLA